MTPDPKILDIMVLAQSMFPKSLGNSIEFVKYVLRLCTEICEAWEKWMSDCLFGGVIVNGSGAGVWSGKGSGGKFLTEIKIEIKSDNIEWQDKFTKALSTVVNAAFGQWISAFQFTGIDYVGVSTATPIAPGIVVAVSVPTLMSTAGDDSKFSTISNDIQKELESAGFTITTEMDIFTKALGESIKTYFNIWRLATVISLNTVVGFCGPAGVSVLNSLPNGKIT